MAFYLLEIQPVLKRYRLKRREDDKFITTTLNQVKKLLKMLNYKLSKSRSKKYKSMSYSLIVYYKYDSKRYILSSKYKITKWYYSKEDDKNIKLDVFDGYGKDALNYLLQELDALNNES